MSKISTYYIFRYSFDFQKCAYLFDIQSYRQTKIETSSIPLVSSPNGHNSQEWARLTPGASSKFACECEDPNHFSKTIDRELEIEEPEHGLTPIWDFLFTGSGFTHYTTTLAFLKFLCHNKSESCTKYPILIIIL